MKKVNKVESIARAFLDDPNVSKEVLEYRRSICDTCELNTKNINESELSLTHKLRKRTRKQGACIACGCDIEAKTTRGNEECGLSYKDKPVKWNRVLVKTISRYDLDLVNLNYDKINVDLSKDGTFFDIHLGDIPKSEPIEFSILLNSKPNTDFEMIYFKPSCGACTEFEIDKVKDISYKVDLKLDLSNEIEEEIIKPIYISYKINGSVKKTKIKLTGKLKIDG